MSKILTNNGKILTIDGKLIKSFAFGSAIEVNTLPSVNEAQEDMIYEVSSSNEFKEIMIVGLISDGALENIKYSFTDAAYEMDISVTYYYAKEKPTSNIIESFVLDFNVYYIENENNIFFYGSSEMEPLGFSGWHTMEEFFAMALEAITYQGIWDGNPTKTGFYAVLEKEAKKLYIFKDGEFLPLAQGIDENNYMPNIIELGQVYKGPISADSAVMLKVNEDNVEFIIFDSSIFVYNKIYRYTRFMKVNNNNLDKTTSTTLIMYKIGNSVSFAWGSGTQPFSVFTNFRLDGQCAELICYNISGTTEVSVPLTLQSSTTEWDDLITQHNIPEITEDTEV